jgi:hypothetical protein
MIVRYIVEGWNAASCILKTMTIAVFNLKIAPDGAPLILHAFKKGAHLMECGTKLLFCSHPTFLARRTTTHPAPSTKQSPPRIQAKWLEKIL